MSPVVAYVCKACTVLSVVRTTSSLSVWTVKKNLKNSVKSQNLSQYFNYVVTLVHQVIGCSGQ